MTRIEAGDGHDPVLSPDAAGVHSRQKEGLVHVRVVSLALIGLLHSTASMPGQEPRSSPTADSRLVERTERRLAQLDVVVTGKTDAIRELSAADFQLDIGGRPITDIIVDRVCEQPAVDPLSTELLIPTTYVFYLDDPSGIDRARALIPLLIKAGSRGMLVWDDRRLETVVPLTQDPLALLEGLDAIQRRAESFVPANRHGARDLASQRLAMLMGQLANVDLPRVVIRLSSRSMTVSDRTLERSVMRAANEHGVRVYQFRPSLPAYRPAEPAGVRSSTSVRPLASGGVPRSSGKALDPTNTSPKEIQDRNRPPTRNPRPASTRPTPPTVFDVDVASPTGGKMLRGGSIEQAARGILEDLSCFYLLSFDPTGLDEDRPLEVYVRVGLPKVEVRARHNIVIQSEDRRLRSRLLGAFASPESITSNIKPRGAVIPTGYDEGRYTALVQVAVDGSTLQAATWMIGASLLSKGRVRDEVAKIVSTDTPRIPVIVESEMQLAPGPHELVLVAHEQNRQFESFGIIGAARIEGSLPPVEKSSTVVGPLHVLQPEQGLFVRGEETKLRGFRTLAESDLARPEAPSAMIGLVCVGKKAGKMLSVRRALTGASTVEFQDVELDLSQEPCAQIRDLIPPDTMSAGEFRYDVRVFRGAEEVASSSRRFFVAEKP